MEIRIYDPSLLLQGIVENYTSLIWTRKYSQAGTFEIHVPITADNIRYFVRGNIVSYPGADEAGVIESIVAKQDTKAATLTIKGRFLTSYLDRRLIHGENNAPYNFSGYVETAMREIITNAAPIPLLELGEIKGYSDLVTFQATYQNLLKYEAKLAEGAGLGFRCIPDFSRKMIIFDVYRGVDHTESQKDRTRVTFSDDFKNIDNSRYTENDQLLKTVCYVGGQGEGAERTWVIVGDNTLGGLARREVKLDATDISPDGLTQEQYEDKLRERGRALLEEKDILVKSFESDTIPDGNFKYKEHYDLGDIVTVKKESWGLSTDIRITEIQEVYERGKLTIKPTFGNPLPDTIDWEDK